MDPGQQYPPYQPAPPDQTRNDTEQLSLLTILWKVYAGIALLGVCLGSFYILMGTAFAATMSSPHSSASPAESTIMSGMFAIFGGFIAIVALTVSILSWLVGTRIGDRTAHTLCYVMSCIVCLNAPLGTGLGVFSLVVLSRPSVKAMFR
jgi:hypothetical protein